MGNKKLKYAPELKVLPPTSEALNKHIYRAYLQTAIWKSFKKADPPNVNPMQYGWKLDADENMLTPTPLPPDVSPLYVLKMVVRYIL